MFTNLINAATEKMVLLDVSGPSLGLNDGLKKGAEITQIQDAGNSFFNGGVSGVTLFFYFIALAAAVLAAIFGIKKTWKAFFTFFGLAIFFVLVALVIGQFRAS